jgi:TIR domain
MQHIKPEISVKVFIGYSYEDQKLYKKLEDHLSSLKNSKKIIIYPEIPAGVNWENQMNSHLNEADIILLLVSSSFMASEYHWNKVVQAALKRYKEGTAWVIPIILKPVDLTDTPLKPLRALPRWDKPVTQWNNQNAAFADIAQGIRIVVEGSLITLRQDAKIRELRNEMEIYLTPALIKLNNDRKEMVRAVSEQKSRKKELEAELLVINTSLEGLRKNYAYAMDKLLQLERKWMEVNEQIDILSGISFMFPIEPAIERVEEAGMDSED